MIVRATEKPAEICALAASQTMKQIPAVNNVNSIIKFCYFAQHTSIFEHASATLYCSGLSRAAMAQITRHRHLSFTCSSQHYQDYRDYGVVSSNEKVVESCEDSIQNYINLVDAGVPVYEARMVLPEAMAVNMYITGNARAWAQVLKARLCSRNVPEVIQWARDVRYMLREWFPELFNFVGPNCEDLSVGKCLEGHMSCAR